MLNFSISSFNDPTGSYSGAFDLVRQMVASAGESINSVIRTPDVTIDIAVQIRTETSVYASMNTPGSYTPVAGQIATVRGYLMHKALTGTDINGSSVEGTLNLGARLMDELVAYLNGGASSYAVTSNMILHELTHGLGFFGNRNVSTGDLTGAYQSIFDTFVTIDGAAPYFTGSTAISVYGGRVPLEPLGSGGSSIYHLNDAVISSDLMTPTSTIGASESVIDLAILRDLGYTLKVSLTSADGHTFYAGAQADGFTGTSTNDIAVYAGNMAGYTVSANGSIVTVTSTTDGSDVDTFTGVEKIQFSDQSYYLPAAPRVAPLDDAYSTQAIRAYLAYFGRPPDPGGLASWVTHLQNPANTIDNMINVFGNSAESLRMYGNSTSTAKVDAIFQYLFGRAPLAEGRTFWANAIDSGTLSMSAAALNIMNGARNANGYNDLTIVNSKIDAARAFLNAIDTEWEVNTYKGESAATNARKYLSTITADATHNAQVVSLVGQVVDSLSGSVDSLFASNGIQLGYY